MRAEAAASTQNESCLGPANAPKSANFAAFPRSSALFPLKRHANPHLHGERNTDRCSRPEEVPQPASRYPKLVAAHNWLYRRAGSISTNVRNVARCGLIRRNRQSRDIRHKVRARVVAIEQVEHLRKRHDRRMVCKMKGTSN